MGKKINDKAVLSYVRNHPSGRVKIAYADVDGILRGKYISSSKFISAVEGDSSFCNVIFGWDNGDVAYDNVQYTGWHTGYPDAPTRIDLSTFRKIPWENDIPFFLGELVEENDKTSICPRQLLKRVIRQAHADGFVPMLTQEFEWFNFAETPQSARAKNYRNMEPLSPGMFGYSILRTALNNPFFSDLFDLLTRFNIPIEGLHTETGPGVLEAAIHHTTGVEAGDRAVLFKTAVKEIALRHGVMATFMAKISESLPGCGGHVHQSLMDKSGKKNMFFDGNDKQKMSAVMRHYLAGQLHCLPYLLPLYAPTINSYKRLVEGAWAPTTRTWGIDNRTVAVRVINGSRSACRMETRVIGADANPYLAMAAAVGSGLYGIRKKLKLKQPATIGNGYADFTHGVLPGTLEDATRHMKDSPLAAEMLGKGFVDHFVHTREWEWRQHLKPVTDWEMKRYFEII
ncbi:MAG: glutamine synthetase [Cytophagales bacterium]|nr:glutamine synthetase [Cytophagales bacterium]